MSEWKMVPVEPTDEMIHAIDGLICSSYLWPVYAYRAMIDAAPVQQTDPLGYFTFNKEWNVWEQMSAKYKNASDATPLYLHPPADEVQQAEPVGEVRSETCHYSMMPDRICNKCGRIHGYSHPHAAYLRGVDEGKRQAAAPQQAEPVAQIGWADEFGNLFPMGAWKPTQRTHHDSHKAAWRPVFLHPPADEVRRLRDALDEIESETQDVSIQQIARKALEGK